MKKHAKAVEKINQSDPDSMNRLFKFSSDTDSKNSKAHDSLLQSPRPDNLFGSDSDTSNEDADSNVGISIDNLETNHTFTEID